MGQGMERITSPHNPAVQAARALLQRRERQTARAFLIEGMRIVEEAVQAGVALRTLFLCPEMLGPAATALVAGWSTHAERVVELAPAALRALADTETPQGVIAVVDLPDTIMPALHPRDALVLVLDGVRDPGNVGTLIRTAAAAGCTAFVTTAGSADAFAPKVVRAAMGMHFRLPVIADVAWEWLGPTIAALPVSYVTDGDATLTYDTVDWTRGAAIVVGHEDRGVSPDALAWCTGTVVIPMARDVESLNAAMSGAVVLFEATRQRRNADIATKSLSHQGNTTLIAGS